MIAIKSWIERLIERCAKTNEKNTYTATQRFSDCIESKNSTFNSKTPPTANNSGVSNRIIFLDKNERHLGSIDVFRTLSDSRGIRFTVGSNHLGFQLSDEGIATSFVNHPYEDGPDTQIATVKYVDESDSELAEEIKKLIDITRLHSNQIAEILLHLSAINELILNIDELPTEGSKNLVYSGGVYSYLQDNLEEIKNFLTQYIDEYLEEHRVFDITENQAGFVPKVGMIRQCFVNANNKGQLALTSSDTLVFRAGDTVSGKHLFLGNYWFQADGEDAQYSFIQKMNGSESYFKAASWKIMNDSSWSIDNTKYNTIWVSLSPVRTTGDYACSFGLFMCISVTKLGD